MIQLDKHCKDTMANYKTALEKTKEVNKSFYKDTLAHCVATVQYYKNIMNVYKDVMKPVAQKATPVTEK